MPRIATTRNLAAFLDMIAHSEGTAGKGDDGYNVIVGGKLFDTYADHPRVLVHLRPGLASTAAGRYQLLERFFDSYKAQLDLADFSPANQDLIALRQIKECGALEDVKAGQTAVRSCARIWASLPGSPYGQRTNEMEALQDIYIGAGGNCLA